MAHNDFSILKKLLVLLDHSDNDIYLHIDSKVQNFNEKYYQKLLKYASLFFTKRTNVIWGDYNQINCELLLLKEANNNYKYDYYHLISGVDLPLKSQEEIHDFFSKNKGKEFVHFNSLSLSQSTYERASLYHLFTRYGRNKGKIISFSDRVFLKIQRILKVDRTKKDNQRMAFGANWFSITNNLAEYVINKESEISNRFQHTICADELFLQTLVYNSPFKNNLYYDKMDENYIACMRFIDWHREDCTSSPHTWRLSDYNELISSDYLFARKFDSKVDSAVIDKIYNYVIDKSTT